MVEQAVLSVLVAAHLVSPAGLASLPPCSLVSCSHSRRACVPGAGQVPLGSPGLVGMVARSQHLAPGAPCPSARSATCTQAVDVRLRCRLCLAILLRRGIARRTERHRIPSLPWREVTSDAKVDQVETAHGGAHDIARLDITEDDGGLTGVEVPQHGAELHPHSEDLRNGQMLAFGAVEILLQGLPLDKVHHQVPVFGVDEVVMDARQVGVLQASEQAYLAVEGIGGFDDLLRAEMTQGDGL